jgi:hypothetical protein
MFADASSRISCAFEATLSTSRDLHFMRFGNGGGSPTIHSTCPAKPTTIASPEMRNGNCP